MTDKPALAVMNGDREDVVLDERTCPRQMRQRTNMIRVTDVSRIIIN